MIIISLTVVTVSVFWSSSGGSGEGRVEVDASGAVYIIPLSHNSSMVFSGPVGETRVEVADGKVFISDSDCRDKICVAMGAVSSPSSWVACLPNRVFVRIVAEPSKEGMEVDTGAY